MIQYFPNSSNNHSDKTFSIIIPSWNNLSYLKLCIESIRKNSRFKHQIIVHVNEGTDGTLDWIKNEALDYTYTIENIGICLPMNAAASLVKTDYIAYFNDDMYAAPDWDFYIFEKIKELNHPYFYISSTMIEHTDTGSAVVVAPIDFGKDIQSFRETDFLLNFNNYHKDDWYGSTFPPSIMHKKIWELVGGFSIEFSPGMGSDPDLAMKLWFAGVREFIGLGQSRVYHFMTKTTTKIKKNDGRMQFFKKWRMSNSTFYKYYLKFGQKYNGALPEVSPILPLKVKLKEAYKRFKN